MKYTKIYKHNKIRERKYKKYTNYINSKEWKSKVIVFKELKENKCQQCFSTKNLQIHHIDYFNLYKETIKDVMLLCSKCHKLKHLNKNSKKDIKEKDTLWNKIKEDVLKRLK